MGDIYGMLNKVSIDDYYKPPLFSMMRSLVKLNDMQWLRADTFSWQDGTLYEVAYNKLVEEYDSIPTETFYRWDGNNGATYYLKKNADVVTGDAIYAGTPNLNIHSVGIVTVSGSVVRYGGVTLTLITTSGSAVNSIAYEVEGDVAYTRSANDYKICEPSQENNVLSKYNTQGIAMYFILDKANKRFKLPRTKFGFEGLRTSVGDDIEAGLPPITGAFPDWIGANGYQGVFYNTSTSSHGTANSPLTNPSDQATGFDASRSSSIYGNSNTVQPPATQTYLYFYVGEYKEDAIKNTAGLNSELFNNKLDLDANNFDTNGKSLFSGLGMPSGKYTDLTLGASDSIYTAPANGYYYLNIASSELSGASFISLYNETKMYGVLSNTYRANTSTYISQRCFLPVCKGDVINIGYTMGTIRITSFRFIYAEGEV